MALVLIPLGLTAAPLAMDVAAEPYSAVFIPALHGTVVDRAPALIISASIAAIRLLGLALLLLARAFAEAIWLAAHLLKVGDCTTGLFEQFLSCLPSQGQLALEAFRRDVSCVPGGRRLGEQRI